MRSRKRRKRMRLRERWRGRKGWTYMYTSSPRISHKLVGEPTKSFIVALFCTGINPRLNQEGYSVMTGVTLCSFSSFLRSKYPIQGFTIQDGPLRLKSVWFNSFPPNENRSASAIGFQPSTQWPSFPNNDVQDMQFGFDDGVSMTSLKGPMGHFRSSLASVLISHSSYLWIDHQHCTTHNYAIQFSRENRVFVQRSGLKEISFIDHTNGNRPLPPPPPHPPLCPHHPPPLSLLCLIYVGRQ